MKKQVLRTVLATATAFSIAVMPALTVCAEDVTEPVDGYDCEMPLKIDGNVSVTGSEDFAVYAGNESHDITIKGSVTLTTDQDVAEAVVVEEGGKVTVGGDVICISNADNDDSENCGIYVDEGVVIVGGNVSAQSENGSATAIHANGEDDNVGVVIVQGDVSASAPNTLSAGVATECANVYVNGNVDALYGVGMRANDDSNESVVVMGTIRAEYGFSLEGTPEDDMTEQEFADNFPNVVVYAIDMPDDGVIAASGNAGDLDDELIAELFVQTINYIIHTEGTVALSGDDLGKVSDFTSSFMDIDKDYSTTKLGKTFTATVGSNYTLSGSRGVDVKKVSDGVYSVTLTDSKGGILLTATALTPDPTPGPGPDPDQPVVIIIPDTEPGSGSGSESSGSSSDSASDPVPNDAIPAGVIPAGAITISLPRNAELTATAAVANGPAVLGASREPARAATLKMAKLTDAQYKDAVIKNISDTPAGGLFRLETDRIATFDRAMLEAFAKRSNVDMEVLFPLGSKKISVMIPAGYDINKLLDNKGYCGFLRLLAILGGEVVDK